MKKRLTKILETAKNEILAADNTADLEDLRIKYLGKKGELTKILRSMGELSPEERPVIGQLANEIRVEIENILASFKNKLIEKEKEKTN